METESVENYLKAIYQLREAGGRVTTSALARELEVSPSSATLMIKRLAERKLVLHEPYRGVRLTRAGERVALEVIRHHRLLELYLTEALGLPWDEVHAEAERLEHHLSDEVEARIDVALGHPTHDPHGAPIPSVELVIAPDESRSLDDLDEGAVGVVAHVPDEDPALLRYLADVGLAPAAEVRIVERTPSTGLLTLEVGRQRHAIARDLAARIAIRGSG